MLIRVELMNDEVTAVRSHGDVEASLALGAEFIGDDYGGPGLPHGEAIRPNVEGWLSGCRVSEPVGLP